MAAMSVAEMGAHEDDDTCDKARPTASMWSPADLPRFLSSVLQRTEQIPSKK